MNWSRLVCVTPPTAKPLSLAAAKAHLRIDGNDEDADVEALIAEAVAMIDGPNGIGIAMVEQTWRLSLDRFERGILLPLNPVRVVQSVTYVDTAGDTQTIDPGDYQVDYDRNPALLTPTYGTAWPTARCVPGAVKVTFRAGYAATDAAETDVPGDLVRALKLLVGDGYAFRETAAAGAVASIPVSQRAQDILNRYRVIAPA